VGRGKQGDAVGSTSDLPDLLNQIACAVDGVMNQAMLCYGRVVQSRLKFIFLDIRDKDSVSILAL
jgi:hypothetical protein